MPTRDPARAGGGPRRPARGLPRSASSREGSRSGPTGCPRRPAARRLPGERRRPQAPSRTRSASAAPPPACGARRLRPAAPAVQGPLSGCPPRRRRRSRPESPRGRRPPASRASRSRSKPVRTSSGRQPTRSRPRPPEWRSAAGWRSRGPRRARRRSARGGRRRIGLSPRSSLYRRTRRCGRSSR